ncbi:hypothetical protein JW930_07635 [Candidatus Woesearchaeota archaeon]|nr:hypothetical protein [Candidatus Woesearchaeota archaeon]
MSKWQSRIEEFILLTLIIVTVFEFFGVLPGEIEFIKKVVAWTALGYLLYKVSLSDIFFGHKHRHIDIILILSYFLLVLKNMVDYVHLSFEHSGYLISFYQYILDNALFFEQISFYIGCASLILLSFYITYCIDIKEPSIIHVIHGSGKSKLSLKSMVRLVSVYLVILGFFVIVFNFIIEWLGFALDAPVLIFAILFYILRFHKYSKGLDKRSLLYKISELGEELAQRFIKLFHNKNTIFLGISGILVLHLIVDYTYFIIPEITGLYDIVYFGKLSADKHMTLLSLIRSDWQTNSLVNIFLVVNYVMNLVIVSILMVFPAFIWYVLSGFDTSLEKIPNAFIALFFSSLIFFMLSPAYRFEKLSNSNYIGVDIVTHNVFLNEKSTVIFGGIALFTFFMIWILSKKESIKQKLLFVATMVTLVFFGYYLSFYLTGWMSLYWNYITILFSKGQFFLSYVFLVFLLITAVFYVGGYIIYCYNIFEKEN